ncbi:T-Box (Tbx) transcription factor [Oopsacas minuta]|uniref:T-Box (Tbx) transcription factor n=1 Tax=Oopsacas minuta TaxID=111878 RepID=A0AAV7JS29_9METZ|nr:T-Box (Tbx) transcription factor [Oopsacas minuta]
MAESLVEAHNSESEFVDPIQSISNNSLESLAPILDHEISNGLSSNVRVVLENNPLWDEFHTENTEMIITKAGRRMFPEIRIRVLGLEMDERYIMVMDLAPYDDNRYKYHENEWVVAGKADPPVQGRLYIHPDSPSVGRDWMKQPISFQKMKLTNNNLDQNGYIILNSMHKYQARIHIVLMDVTDDKCVRKPSSFSTHTFKETVFYAVTAYQNPKITKLKIKYNAFAKGFRSSDHHPFCYQDGTYGTPQQYAGIIEPSHVYHNLSSFPKQEVTSPNLTVSLPQQSEENDNSTPTSQEQAHSTRDDFFYPPYPSMMRPNQPYMQTSSQIPPMDPSLYLTNSSLYQRP